MWLAALPFLCLDISICSAIRVPVTAAIGSKLPHKQGQAGQTALLCLCWRTTSHVTSATPPVMSQSLTVRSSELEHPAIFSPSLQYLQPIDSFIPLFKLPKFISPILFPSSNTSVNESDIGEYAIAAHANRLLDIIEIGNKKQHRAQ
ncbi:hypothetical protein QBC40DRAFT_283738 [Triangularia verruculosa]|uniref:Uncharacterized protein n=1 Tax=Triangularia verruculosa TaxID=2587418 RepID=A0AAN6XE37_9PEZI|nr:hypothetical protein QBC40DRAFT_283738 [Triangularia verruculosa]